MEQDHYDAGDGFGADDDDDGGAVQHYEPPEAPQTAGGEQTWTEGDMPVRIIEICSSPAFSPSCVIQHLHRLLPIFYKPHVALSEMPWKL